MLHSTHIGCSCAAQADLRQREQQHGTAEGARRERPGVAVATAPSWGEGRRHVLRGTRGLRLVHTRLALGATHRLPACCCTPPPCALSPCAATSTCTAADKPDVRYVVHFVLSKNLAVRLRAGVACTLPRTPFGVRGSAPALCKHASAASICPCPAFVHDLGPLAAHCVRRGWVAAAMGARLHTYPLSPCCLAAIRQPCTWQQHPPPSASMQLLQ